ncbi:dolichol phosphate-mannose biosynthesis regulatory protein-domain-containing protein [Fimicolochytrium jonesii]|uniref:dolichol phosphate-mannose biosynthesis regulatory protein-domain-containing protein n=1 Tax=Fimicolochytrium jonesii TaxID=1396493 RepID=UPI0022FF1FDE|nr:dolichol phosphate-mannose biosynthesis regulatory protein-domain-containing protein [Fimicolochytrium jonesii]KAI8822229.1 dolichol phosphate-mannose biosynthesis regulatory protein-domain-containing protein [Fimicolochytrium jonesii]
MDMSDASWNARWNNCEEGPRFCIHVRMASPPFRHLNVDRQHPLLTPHPSPHTLSPLPPLIPMLTPGTDRLTGLVLSLLSLFFFVYYTLWTIILPLVDPSHPFVRVFPDPSWAVRGPVVLFVGLTGAVGAFVAVVMIRSGG